jgi:hypothetical protein
MNPISSSHRQLVLIAALLCAGAAGIRAQETEKKEAAKKEVDLQNVQTPKKDAPLPKIDLPEFVITGSEKIELNIDSKSESDQDRIFAPSAPTPGERPVNVGEALTPKQVKSFTKTPGAMNGKVYAGFGFYGTPQFDGWFGQYDPTSSFVLNGYYSESQGHVTDAGYWNGGFGVRGSTSLPESSSVLPFAQLSAEMKYDRDSYRSYASTIPSQVRDLSRFEISSGIGSRYALPYRALSGVDYSAKAGWTAFSAADSFRTSENEFLINGSASTRFFETSIRGQIEYRGTGYTMQLPGVRSGHWFLLRAEGRQSIIPALQVTVSLQQYLYRGNVGPASGRLYPGAEIRYTFVENASLYAGFNPAVERNSLSSLIKQNRYVNFSMLLVPTDTRINAYAGMEFSPLEELTATFKMTYKHINNYPTFYDKNSAKVWEVLYLSDIRSTKFDLSAQYRLNQKQNVTAYVSAQTVKQRDSSVVLPHIPKFTIGAAYHHFFDIGLHAEAFAELNGSRFTDFSNSHSNAGYVYTGMKAEMEIFGQFRAHAELNNLIDQQYFVWNGYKERTVFLLLGISYHW